MTVQPNGEFRWDNLLGKMENRDVIPVLGAGLYSTRTPEGKDIPLYPCLAGEIAREFGLPGNPEEEPGPNNPIESFTRAVSQFLEKNPREGDSLRLYLRKRLKNLTPVYGGPLWQLARISAFPLFITTTHDGFLEQVLNGVRDYPTHAAYYTSLQKRKSRLTESNLTESEEGRLSIVYHVYGSAVQSASPAFSEKDILETVVDLQKDMWAEPENPFFRKLQDSSLLFIGCGYEDWLFRFFIRSMTGRAYGQLASLELPSFVGEDFKSYPRGRLPGFLKAHGAEVYFSGGCGSFVEELFRRCGEQFPRDIIGPEDFPRLAFISFHGKDRDVARRLAENLEADGIPVWLDETRLHPGQVSDDEIIKAISRSAVFIPLVSRAASELQSPGAGGVRYHVREWEWAYSRHLEEGNPRRIIPVNIDGTSWKYPAFDKLIYPTIPGGGREGEYPKLLEELRKILEQVRQGRPS